MSGWALFQAGDMQGDEKRAAAVIDAIHQGVTQEPGSARARIYGLQACVGELPPVEFPLQHVFAPGVYARTMQIPRGSVIVGKIHKHKHINILSKGDVSVFTEAGGSERLQGPLTMVSEPGTKRVVYAHADSVWTTIHLTSETDLARIEDEVIAKTYAEYEQFLLSGSSQLLEVSP